MTTNEQQLAPKSSSFFVTQYLAMGQCLIFVSFTRITVSAYDREGGIGYIVFKVLDAESGQVMIDSVTTIIEPENTVKILVQNALTYISIHPTM